MWHGFFLPFFDVLIGKKCMMMSLLGGVLMPL